MTPRIEVIYKIHDAWRASLEQELKTARATLQEEREDHADAATAAWNERREDVAPLDPSSPADLRRAADLLEVLDVDWRPPGGMGGRRRICGLVQRESPPTPPRTSWWRRSPRRSQGPTRPTISTATGRGLPTAESSMTTGPALVLRSP